LSGGRVAQRKVEANELKMNGVGRTNIWNKAISKLGCAASRDMKASQIRKPNRMSWFERSEIEYLHSRCDAFHVDRAPTFNAAQSLPACAREARTTDWMTPSSPPCLMKHYLSLSTMTCTAIVGVIENCILISEPASCIMTRDVLCHDI
jgi:hypothetical protein